MQPPVSLGNTPEYDTGRMDGPETSMPVIVPESNTGRGATVPLASDLRLSTGATPEVSVRAKRVTKPIERLVVGNPGGWHFNRAKPRR